MRNSTGSVRQRGTNSWELRIYQGVDPENGKERWATKTVRGSRRFATAQLQESDKSRYAVVFVRNGCRIAHPVDGGCVTGLGCDNKRETKSLIDRHLVPCLGHLVSRS